MAGAAFKAPLVVETLARAHDRGSFNCGCGPLDEYLHRRALQDQRRRASVCHVLVSPAQPARIVGYYTLSSYTLRLAGLPAALSGKLPRYPDVPCALLGRLAVDTAFYRRYGFIPLPATPQTLFLPMATIAVLFAP